MRQEVAERRQRDEEECRAAVEGANKMKFEQVRLNAFISLISLIVW